MRRGGMRCADHLTLRELIGEDFIRLSPYANEWPVLWYRLEFLEEVAIDVLSDRFYRKRGSLLGLALNEFSPKNRPVEARRVYEASQQLVVATVFTTLGQNFTTASYEQPHSR